MIFTRPVKFEEALQARRVKRVLPTTASAAELQKLEPEIRERARFLARVNHAGAVAELHRQVDGVLGMDGDMFDPATARAEMKLYLKSIAYDPENPPKGFEPAKPGSLRDISSDGRLNLVLDTNLKMAHGYGQFAKANDPELIDAFPCQELYRLEERKEKRDWRMRWVQAGGKLYGADARMIARKDDPIWTAISAFGLPYPPFDYNSGMWVEEIDRDEAEALGVIKPSTVVQPQERKFNSDVSAALPSDLPAGLANAVLKSFGDSVKVEAGRLILAAASAQ